MADMTTSSFPKMGENPLVGTIVNISGNRSPYTHPVALPSQGDAAAIGGTSIRSVGSDATGENAGPRFAPVTMICFPNDPAASQTGRGLRIVRSAVGNSDFWDRRYESGAAY
jgi:hypothetical protein